MDNATDVSRSLPFDITRAIVWLTSSGFLIALNGPCLLVLLKTSSINEITKVFLTSMTACDLGVAAFFVLPAFGISCAGFWPYGDVFCVIQAVTVSRFYHAGTMSLLAVNLERYVAISWPLRYAQMVTLFRARVMVGIIWAINMLSLIAMGFAAQWHIEYIPDRQLCDFDSDEIGLDIFVYFSFITFEAIPLSLTIVLYTRLVIIARRQARQIAALERTMAGAMASTSNDNSSSEVRKQPHRLDMKAAMTFIYVTCALVVAWIPFHVVELRQADSPVGVVFFTNVLLVSNSWWNVAIYYVRNKAFRRASRKVFANMFPCVSHDPAELITDATIMTGKA